jgi:hypothetical protein
MARWVVTRTTTKLMVYVVEADTEEEAIEAAVVAGEGEGVLSGPSAFWGALPLADDPDEPIWIPRGWGTYCRRIVGGVPEAQALVQRCARASIGWVALMVEANDGYTVPLETTRNYAEVLQGAGIDVAVWTFPGQARAASVQASRDAANLALTYAEEADARVVLLDIEAPYKNHPEELRTLIETVEFGRGEDMSLGVVSFPVPSWHPTLDTSAFSLADWGSPMLYDTAQEPEAIELSTREWSELTDVVIPSIRAGETLAGDIERVFGPGPKPKFRAGVVWSEQQLDDTDLRTLQAAAERYGWET